MRIEDALRWAPSDEGTFLELVGKLKEQVRSIQADHPPELSDYGIKPTKGDSFKQRFQVTQAARSVKNQPLPPYLEGGPVVALTNALQHHYRARFNQELARRGSEMVDYTKAEKRLGAKLRFK